MPPGSHRIRCRPPGLHDAACPRAGDGGTDDYHHDHRGHLSTRRLGALSGRQGVPVERLEWMAGNTGETPQVLVLTGDPTQGAMNLTLHALQALPEVAGPGVQWRVALLDG